jgi:hypothetical protein
MSESRLKKTTETAALTRPRFFNGKLITAADLELEQEYFRAKSKLHNRSLHGFGIVSGLKVTVSSDQVFVEPGLALDCEGNELVIETAQSIVPPAPDDSRMAYLNLRFVEEGGDPVPIAGGDEASNITESFELSFAPENSNRGHRHLRARWLSCGKSHALTIAKLKQGAQGWRVERGYRPPTIK